MAQVTELLADHAVADPYSHFAGLREAAPLHRDECLGAWLVLRYDDVRAAFRDTRLSSDRVSPYFERRRVRGGSERERTTFEVLTRWIVFSDPPRHTRLRKLVEYAFRPRAVERMRGWIASLVDELVEGLGDERELDFVERFASPLPVRVHSLLPGSGHRAPGGRPRPRCIPGAVPARVARRRRLRVGPAHSEPLAQAPAGPPRLTARSMRRNVHGRVDHPARMKGPRAATRRLPEARTLSPSVLSRQNEGLRR